MGSPPAITVTDQDPAMKVAIAQEFPETRHRYCMWHIMTKVGDKVGTDLARNEEFRRELNTVVWNDASTTANFEHAWKAVMEKYAITENSWLKHMYDERASWVLACFEGVFMGGLLRTTSRSEAENRIFRSNTNKHLCLTEFFIRFESTVRKQRITHAHLSGASNAQTPLFKTPLGIERHASELYTLTVFYDVQEEIIAGCFECRVRAVTIGDGIKTYEVDDKRGTQYGLTVEDVTMITHCPCRMYTRIGLLCRHAFAVLIYERVDTIPPQQITPRWTRNVITEYEDELRKYGYGGAITGNEASDVINTFYSCLGIAKGDSLKLQQMCSVLSDMETTWCGHEEVQVDAASGKQAIMESYCGVPAPETITVHQPPVTSNKGSGKRMRSAKELAMKEQNRKKRTCKTCGMADGHNSRSCPQK
ncbi:PREDICTED: protein FAR1-RELATED SEQUENCE 5-like [Ipomoea nil]|uniref:protein FAR1-RELATED SEQUENCE 5-like n=2 Tax=Ipomoea nil TaxID=35883 RepID=UPI000900E7E4|nr:PREDICTED: protein FAR1-RELATED SEQUENCE 5-like [Ipomoea nil]